MYFWDKHKTITSYYELLSGEVCDQYEITQMEYDIIMFLHNNPHHNTAAEIVRIRKSTKSHVSSSLKKLENKGLIKRKQSKDNKKHIEIDQSHRYWPQLSFPLSIRSDHYALPVSLLLDITVIIAVTVFYDIPA